MIPALKASSQRLGVAEWSRVCVGVKLDKGQQCSDWEARPLSQSQVSHKEPMVSNLMNTRKRLTTYKGLWNVHKEKFLLLPVQIRV